MNRHIFYTDDRMPGFYIEAATHSGCLALWLCYREGVCDTRRVFNDTGHRLLAWIELRDGRDATKEAQKVFDDIVANGPEKYEKIEVIRAAST